MTVRDDKLRRHDLNAKAGKTCPLSIRLTRVEREQLAARAYTLSANINSVARDLIRSGLAGGDARGLAERLQQMDRRLVVLEQQCRDGTQNTHKLLAMFDALLKVLTEGRPP
ncbi:MAG: hypothetical protein KGJ79_10115 [Alphaproteobacteria bacterium]|nr:hypothetical protein [Alphaproteobacteria bacterium]MDE2111484.1 hypothetical protein [Alphaproteobacteria bacterium]MDE2493971.1 hypothetical protein [Alphaproteobacteria bacterium]